jgi:hypothetical protein
LFFAAAGATLRRADAIWLFRVFENILFSGPPKVLNGRSRFAPIPAAAQG